MERRGVGVGTLMCALAVELLACPTAGATTSYHESLRYIETNLNLCVYVKAQISTDNNGTNYARVKMLQNAIGGTSCNQAGFAFYPGPGNLQIGFYNYKDGAVCTTGWYYQSSSNVSSFAVQFSNAKQCGGPASYQTKAWGNWWNGAWLGAGSPPGGNPVLSGSIVI